MSFLNRSQSARIVILAAAFLFVAFYVEIVVKTWRADWLQERRDKKSLEASAGIEPSDARTFWMLGRYFLNTAQDPISAINNFNRAVSLDQFEARYWLDLAAAYELVQASDKSQYALDRALRAEPTSPSIAWEAGTFYLAGHNTDRALPLFRVAMEYDPRTTTAALNLCWRSTHSVARVVKEALPNRSDPYFAFLKLLSEQNQHEAANKLWDAFAERKIPFQVDQTFPYFDYLIETKQVDQAKEVWRFLGSHNPELGSDSNGNLVSDGGFERKYLDGAFGWRHRRRSEIDVSLDTGEFHSGTRALRFVFFGPAISDMGVYQYVPVQPNTAYRLSAFVKSQDIVSASGPRLVIQDPYDNQALASTDDLLATTGWREQVVDFSTRPFEQLVTISVIRNPGNPLIKGSFWLDDVKLTATPAP